MKKRSSEWDGGLRRDSVHLSAKYGMREKREGISRVNLIGWEDPIPMLLADAIDDSKFENRIHDTQNILA